MDEQPFNVGILDLATHKTCGAPSRGGARWALTPPFHPCHPQERRAVVFCHVVSAVTRGFPLESMVLCVARTFLGPRRADAREDRDGPPGCLYFVAKLQKFVLTAKDSPGVSGNGNRRSSKGTGGIIVS